MSNPKGNVVRFVLPAEMHQAEHFIDPISQQWAAFDKEIATHARWLPNISSEATASIGLIVVG